MGRNAPRPAERCSPGHTLPSRTGGLPGERGYFPCTALQVSAQRPRRHSHTRGSAAHPPDPVCSAESSRTPTDTPRPITHETKNSGTGPPRNLQQPQPGLSPSGWAPSRCLLGTPLSTSDHRERSRKGVLPLTPESFPKATDFRHCKNLGRFRNPNAQATSQTN